MLLKFDLLMDAAKFVQFMLKQQCYRMTVYRIAITVLMKICKLLFELPVSCYDYSLFFLSLMFHRSKSIAFPQLFVEQKFSVDIKKGDVISLSYCQPLHSTMQRRVYLRHSKCFDCLCQRCRDSTECGTYIGSSVCQRCKIAKLLPDDPLDATSDWKCANCSLQVTATNFQYIQSRLQFAIENLSKQSPYDFETFLEKYSYRPKQSSSSTNGTEEDLSVEILLHEQNTFALQIKYALTQLYGNVGGFLWHGTFHCSSICSSVFLENVINLCLYIYFSLLFCTEICDTDLSRKISLSEELLEVAKILEPGQSIFRGKLLVDLQEALFVQTERLLNRRDISMVVAKVCIIFLPYNKIHWKFYKIR